MIFPIFLDTIPLKFYERLNFGREAECFLADDAVVIRPLSASSDNFTMEILKDLVAQGYGGNELIEKFVSKAFAAVRIDMVHHKGDSLPDEIKRQSRSTNKSKTHQR